MTFVYLTTLTELDARLVLEIYVLTDLYFVYRGDKSVLLHGINCTFSAGDKW